MVRLAGVRVCPVLSCLEPNDSRRFLKKIVTVLFRSNAYQIQMSNNHWKRDPESQALFSFISAKKVTHYLIHL